MAGALALGLLLGASAQALTVETREGDPSQAVQIRDLVIDSNVYVVEWSFAPSVEPSLSIWSSVGELC